jgi:hypothetical protein
MSVDVLCSDVKICTPDGIAAGNLKGAEYFKVIRVALLVESHRLNPAAITIPTPTRATHG